MANPRDEMSVGYPPYEEAAAKVRLRSMRGGSLSFGNIIGRALQRGALQVGMAGLGSVPPGSNFGTAFLAGMGGAAKAQTALDATRMADEYRQQQIGLERANLNWRMSPENPANMPKPADPLLEERRALLRAQEDAARARAEAARRPKPPVKGKAAAAAPKPKQIPKHIPAGLHKTEADLLREIGWSPSTPDEIKAMPDFMKHLADILTGKAEYDSADLRRAAQLRLNQIQREGR